MKATAKYLFDVDFAAGEKPTITMVEHERRRADAESQAYREGFTAGEQQAHQEATKRLADALSVIADGLGRVDLHHADGDGATVGQVERRRDLLLDRDLPRPGSEVLRGQPPLDEHHHARPGVVPDLGVLERPGRLVGPGSRRPGDA